MSFPQLPSITNYGAVAVLVDNFPIKDPSSELAAASINQLRNDLTAVCQSAPICRFQVLGTTGTPVITGSPTWTTGFRAGWSLNVVPGFNRNSTGNITFNLPPTVQDFLGNTGVPVNITDVHVNVLGQSFFAQVTINSSIQCTVQLMDNTNTPSDFVGSYITFIVS